MEQFEVIRAELEANITVVAIFSKSKNKNRDIDIIKLYMGRNEEMRPFKESDLPLELLIQYQKNTKTKRLIMQTT